MAMRTERPTGVKATINALASSTVLVCRRRPHDAPLDSRRELIDALKAELPPALVHLQPGNVVPVDIAIAQAAIGPGMAIFTRYAEMAAARLLRRLGGVADLARELCYRRGCARPSCHCSAAARGRRRLTAGRSRVTMLR